MNSTNTVDSNFVLVDGNDLNLNKTSKDSFTWTDETTKLLIREYKGHMKNVGRYPQLQTKKDLWELVTREINKHGYHLTPIQTRNRLTTLARAFKKKVRQSGTPQKIVRDPELQNELNEIFMMKPYEEFSNFDSEGHETSSVSHFGETSVQDPLPELSFADAPFIFGAEREAGDLYKWDHRTTELLFIVYDEVNGNEVLMKQFKTKMNMWNHITERLNEYGYIFSSLQVQNRIKTIIRAYKRHLKRGENRVNEVSIFPFEEQIKRVIQKHFNGTLSPKKEKQDLFEGSLDEYDINDKDDIANVIVPNQLSSSSLSSNIGPNVSLDEDKLSVCEMRLLREEIRHLRGDFEKFKNEHTALFRENNELLKCLIDKMPSVSQPM